MEVSRVHLLVYRHKVGTFYANKGRGEPCEVRSKRPRGFRRIV